MAEREAAPASVDRAEDAPADPPEAEAATAAAPAAGAKGEVEVDAVDDLGGADAAADAAAAAADDDDLDEVTKEKQGLWTAAWMVAQAKRLRDVRAVDVELCAALAAANPALAPAGEASSSASAAAVEPFAQALLENADAFPTYAEPCAGVLAQRRAAWGQLLGQMPWFSDEAGAPARAYRLRLASPREVRLACELLDSVDDGRQQRTAGNHNASPSAAAAAAAGGGDGGGDIDEASSRHAAERLLETGYFCAPRNSDFSASLIAGAGGSADGARPPDLAAAVGVGAAVVEVAGAAVGAAGTAAQAVAAVAASAMTAAAQAATAAATGLGVADPGAPAAPAAAPAAPPAASGDNSADASAATAAAGEAAAPAATNEGTAAGGALALPSAALAVSDFVAAGVTHLSGANGPLAQPMEGVVVDWRWWGLILDISHARYLQLVGLESGGSLVGGALTQSLLTGPNAAVGAILVAAVRLHADVLRRIERGNGIRFNIAWPALSPVINPALFVPFPL